MDPKPQVKPPASFWIITSIALLWNLSGVWNFLVNVTMSDADMANLPEAERALMESSPGWLIVIFGIAVFAGLLGSILLLMRKLSALRLLVVSLIAILVQMIYSLFYTKAVEVYGIVGVVMPIIVISIGVFLVWYAGFCKRKGWIS